MSSARCDGWQHLLPRARTKERIVLSATAFTPLFAKCKLQNDIRVPGSMATGAAPTGLKGRSESGKCVRPQPSRTGISSVMSTSKFNVICVEGANEYIIEQKAPNPYCGWWHIYIFSSNWRMAKAAIYRPKSFLIAEHIH